MASKPSAQNIRLTKLDAEGAPAGPTVAIESLVATTLHPDGSPMEMELGSLSVSVDIVSPPPEVVYLATGGAVGHAPIPTAFRAEWWPAAVRLPGRPQPIPLAKVYATREGLYVYSEAPSTGDPNGTRPDFYSPINYDETPRPATGYASRQAGIKIRTGAGDVIVQPLQGCGCSKRTLGNWRPGWGSHVEPWEG